MRARLGGSLCAALASVLLTATACSTSGSPPPGTESRGAPSVVSPDTVHGTVTITGSEPLTALVLATSGGGHLVLEGNAAATLRNVAGLEVMVAGLLTERSSASASPGGLRVFRADAFAVVAADGVPAVDGVLTRVDGIDYIVLHSGRRLMVTHLPSPLRGRIGSPSVHRRAT
jgi:hypothetical protein